MGYPEPGPLWRLWVVHPDGYLIAPFARLGADPRGREPWPAGRAQARCLGGREDVPPGKRCECGIRAMTRLADVLAVMRSVGLLPATSQACAVGKVELSGKVIGPSQNDPRRTWRGKYADLVGPLYVTPNTTGEQRAELVTRYARPVLDWHELPQDEVDGPYSWKPDRPSIGPRKPRARAGRS